MSDGCADMDHRDGGRVTATVPIEPGRALVFAERRRTTRALIQAPAEFVAQLIACNGRLGDFRRARRQSAETGTGRYAEPHRARAFHRFETEA